MSLTRQIAATPLDVRCRSGVQQLVEEGPLALVYLAKIERLMLVPSAHVNRYAASARLATVARALIDRETPARAMNPASSQHVLLAQTPAYPQLANSAA